MGKSKSKSADGSHLSAAEQIHEIHHLSQAAAAELVGLHAKTLRERTGVPRSPAGTYDGPELVQWLAKEIEVLKLDDAEHERVLIAIDIVKNWEDRWVNPVVAVIEALVAEHGTAALAVVGQEILDQAKSEVQRSLGWRISRGPTWEEFQEKERREEAEAEAVRNLRIAVVCEDCDRVREGRKWVRKKVPVGYVTWPEICPACLASGVGLR